MELIIATFKDRWIRNWKFDLELKIYIGKRKQGIDRDMQW